MSVLVRPDIRRPAEIDAQWLTAVLAAGGIDAEVRSFTAREVGTGQIGDSIRFTLDYARAEPGAPASLVGKFPSAGEESRNTGIALGNYIREVRFYQQLAPTALIQTPRCYFTDVEEATSEFVLMMEDLAPAQQGDQLHGVPLAQARLAVEQAARLHASHWADPHLDTLPFVSGSAAAPTSPVTDDRTIELWEAFKVRYGPHLAPHWIEAGDWVASRFVELSLPGESPRCLVHQDFRPDNMMFGTPEGGHPLTVLDWQSIAFGVGATDLGYFLAGALPREVRRAHEPELLELYLDTLAALGVRGYNMAQLRRDYARGGRSLFFTAFFAAMIVTQTARGDAMFLQMLGSGADHMLDTGALG